MNPQTPKLKAAAAGQPCSEVTRLKALWRKMSEEEQLEWSALLESETSRPEIRRQLQARLQIELLHDVQINRFRAWVAAQETQQIEAERVADEIESLIAQGITGEELDEEILRRTKIRALVLGDYSLGLRALRETMRLEKLKLEREKITSTRPTNPGATTYPLAGRRPVDAAPLGGSASFMNRANAPRRAASAPALPRPTSPESASLPPVPPAPATHLVAEALVKVASGPRVAGLPTHLPTHSAQKQRAAFADVQIPPADFSLAAGVLPSGLALELSVTHA
jgi:hypothetical protein